MDQTQDLGGCRLLETVKLISLPLPMPYCSPLFAGLVGAIFGASSSGSLFGQSINLSRVTNSVERAPGSVADLAQRVIPSVVSIEASSKDGGSTGTGFVIESNGYILTNNHVIAEAASNNGDIDVTLNTGQKYVAKIIGRDASYDLAVIKDCNNWFNRPSIRR